MAASASVGPYSANEIAFAQVDCDTLAAKTPGGTISVTSPMSVPSLVASPSGPRSVIATAAVGATVHLTAAQSGAVILNKSTSGSPAFVLPAAALGLVYQYVASNVTEACVFTCADAAVMAVYTLNVGTAKLKMLVPPTHDVP